MRVIAGKARRLLLETPRGTETRPTQDKIKETLFNILAPEIPDCRFLDLFAGSGGIGIEALSRGAEFACFADSSREAVRCIRRNLEWTGFAEQSAVYGTDYLTALRQMEFDGRHFDIVFLDPPYRKDLAVQALRFLRTSSLTDENTLFVVEEAFPVAPEIRSTAEDAGYEIFRVKEYKTNQHWFMKRK